MRDEDESRDPMQDRDDLHNEPFDESEAQSKREGWRSLFGDRKTIFIDASDTEESDEAEDGLEDVDLLKVALSELAELYDRDVRRQAEWDNYRKRTNAERIVERQRASSNLIERLLPVIDDLERAEQHSEGANAESMAEGLRAVLTKFTDVLAYEGLETINPEGEAFDINLHQAVARVEEATVYDETVISVFQKGYSIAGRVLRPAMVAVSSGGPKRVPDPDNNDTGDE